MAAPTKDVPGVRRTILAALRAGATKTDAAHAALVSYDLFNDWCNADSQFLHAVKAAQATCRVRNLARIQKAAASGTWQAAAWLCERTDPESYGRTVQDTRHQGADGGALKFTIKIDRSGDGDSDGGTDP